MVNIRFPAHLSRKVTRFREHNLNFFLNYHITENIKTQRMDGNNKGNNYYTVLLFENIIEK
jgi:hypothetical protein